MTIITHPEADDAFDWSVAEAKAKFSEVVELARRDRPQTVSKNGKPAVVVVSAEEWERKTRRVSSLADFLRQSPLADVRLDVQRRSERPKKLKL